MVIDTESERKREKGWGERELKTCRVDGDRDSDMHARMYIFIHTEREGEG